MLTRKGGSRTFPAGVKVAEVDYESVDSLTAALQGQDAVVATLAAPALGAPQLNLIEAAAKAGVKRFLPSEFGCNTAHPKTATLPVFGGKVAVQKVLEEKAAAGSLSYSYVFTGPFLDWGLMVGFLGVNLKEKTATLYDGGDRAFSSTTLADIGKAVVGVFKNPDATKNRAVFVQSAAPTLKQLLAAGKKATGKPEEWKETVVKTEDTLAEGFAELQKKDANPGIWAIKFLHVGIFGDGYGAYFDKTDNELLGVKGLSSGELEALVARYA